MLKSAEEWGKAQECIVKPMRTYQESAKSKKTISSMVEKKTDNKENKKKGSFVMLGVAYIEKNYNIYLLLFYNYYFRASSYQGNLETD